MGTIPLAIKLLLDFPLFEDAIREPISHYGDSDALEAIIGAVSEAKLGIPDNLRDKDLTYLPRDTGSDEILQEII